MDSHLYNDNQGSYVLLEHSFLKQLMYSEILTLKDLSTGIVTTVLGCENLQQFGDLNLPQTHS